jgi:hypothetical protein
MTLIYTDRQTERHLDDQTKKYSFEEVRELVQTLTSTGTTLITILPCGAGLDFHAEPNGMVWLEFWTDNDNRAATVTHRVAEQLFERAFFLSTLSAPEAAFADLITVWDY